MISRPRRMMSGTGLHRRWQELTKGQKRLLWSADREVHFLAMLTEPLPGATVKFFAMEVRQ
jgi:hypothetical protein